MDEVVESRKRLPEAIANELQDEILGLAVGAKLPTENELAARFQVSRTVVREATRYLVQRGLVAVSPGRGMTVAEFDGRMIADQYALLLRNSQGSFVQLLEVRLVLEVEMAALAAARRSDDQLRAMTEINERLEASVSAKPDFLKADLGFHELVAEASGNPFFALIVRPINGFLGDAYAAGPGYPSEATQTIAEHIEIADAIAAGDPARARYATEHHLRRVVRNRTRFLAAEQAAADSAAENAAQSDN